MGVEYQHFLIPSEPGFIASAGILVKIDAMLERWKLKSGEPKIYDLTNGINQAISEPVASVSFQHGIVLQYPEVQTTAIENIFGESDYGDEVSADDRYVQRIFLIVGTDYRIHPSGGMIDVTVTQPPANGENAITPYGDFEEAFYNLYGEAYDAAKETTAPVTKIDYYGPAKVKKPANFYGFWRAALIFDFGKDVPKLEDDWYIIPNKTFMEDVEKTFGVSLVEIGQIY